MNRISTLALTVALAAGVTAWMVAAEHRGAPPPGDVTPHAPAEWTTTREVRDDALRRAAVRFPAEPGRDETTLPASLSCNFVADNASGTSPKFSCVLANGRVIKVKYGRNPEIQAEVAASTLLRTLGYAADSVSVVPKLRCYGCPRFPYFTAWMRESPLIGRLFAVEYDGAYSEFDQVSAEARFPATAIETKSIKGWGWWELKDSTADPAELDAFRLLALFLAHWDNKSENQRLVCLDPYSPQVPTPPDSLITPHARDSCDAPLLMVQDLGATFGPYKVNLTAWRDAPIWSDARTCVATMRTLPFGGSTFKDVTISEAGRRRLLDRLDALTDADIRGIFTTARFPDYHSNTDDEHDLRQWTAAFRHRVDMIRAGGPCP